jgi:nitroreductase
LTKADACSVKSVTDGLGPVSTVITVLSMTPTLVTLGRMEFQRVVNRRRSVRSYDAERPVPPEIVDRILHNAQRAPSAGFSQGWGFLVLDTQEDIARFRACATPDDPERARRWMATDFHSPLVIIPMSNKDAYLDRYAKPDKGYTDRSDAWWPAPYWDIDTGMAAMLILLTAIDAGLGACLFGIPKSQIGAFRAEFGVPDELTPIGAISIGYSDEPARDLSAKRRPAEQVVHRGQWGSA